MICPRKAKTGNPKSSHATKTEIFFEARASPTRERPPTARVRGGAQSKRAPPPKKMWYEGAWLLDDVEGEDKSGVLSYLGANLAERTGAKAFSYGAKRMKLSVDYHQVYALLAQPLSTTKLSNC